MPPTGFSSARLPAALQAGSVAVIFTPELSLFLVR